MKLQILSLGVVLTLIWLFLAAINPGKERGSEDTITVTPCCHENLSVTLTRTYNLLNSADAGLLQNKQINFFIP